MNAEHNVQRPDRRARAREVVAGLELVFLTLALLTALCGGMVYRYFEYQVLLLTPTAWLLVLVGLWLVRVVVLVDDRATFRRRVRVVGAVVLVAVLVHLADAVYVLIRQGEPEVDWAGQVPREDFKPAGRKLRYPGDNLILISIDTLRADHLGCYGYREEVSPNVDRFAGDAVRFARAHAHVGVTLPSHASMFTSLYPGTHKAEVARSIPLTPEATTLAEVLRDRGYRTAAVVDDAQLDRVWHVDQGFQTYDVAPVEGFRTILPVTLKRLEELKEDKFFLFVHTYDVHTPYRPDPEDMHDLFANYQGAFRPTVTDSLAKAIAGQYVRCNLNDVRYVETAYDGGILWTDAQVGLLLRRIEELGLAGNTVVIITSDHGEGFNEHGRVACHGYHLWEELLHVPLLVRFPDRALAGSVFDYDVSLVDLMPSLLYTLTLPYDGRMQGTNVLPQLEGREALRDLPVFAENQCFDDLHRDQRTYQRGRYKMVEESRTWRDRLSVFAGRSRVLYTLRGRGLYDLYHDYDETRNLLTIDYRVAQAVPVAQYLEGRLRDLVRQGEGFKLVAPEPVELTREERDRLRAMGYIQAVEREGEE